MATANDIDVDFDSDIDRLTLNLERNFRIIKDLLSVIKVDSVTGNVNMSTLPTSPAGLVTGDVWNNLGIPTII